MTRLALPEVVEDRLDRFRQIEPLELQGKPPGLKLRDGQDIDDELQHLSSGLAGVAGVIDIAALIDRPECLSSDHLAETDDRIERCAEFMAHRG